MRRPSNTTLIVGQPLVATLIMLAGAALLYGSWNSGNLIVGVLTLVALGKALDAEEKARKYRTWKRAWDGMVDEAPSSARRPKRKAIFIVTALALLAACLIVSGEPPERYLPGLAVIAGGIGVAWLAIALWRRVPRTKRTPSTDALPVTAIAKPVLPVPTLTDAYLALPDYCRPLLGLR